MAAPGATTRRHCHLPFDERAVLCDNQRAVNKHCSVTSIRLLALLGLLALVAPALGCGQPNDVPHMQEEALAAKARYQERVDELVRRAQLVGQRLGSIPRDAADAVTVRRFNQQVRTTLERARNDLRQVEAKVEAGAKTGKAEELEKVVAALHDRLDSAIVEATSQVSAIESWVAIAEQRRNEPARPAAPSSEPATPSADELAPTR